MRISEIYPAIEGEGPLVGTPNWIVRFAGCNLRCPGWPCDSPYAIYPKEHRKEWRALTVEETAQEVKPWPILVNFSGGEPWLQPWEEMLDLYEILKADGHKFETFTNGTRPLPDWVYEDFTITMDWKLPGSGEWMGFENDKRKSYIVRLKPTDAVKFVVKDRDDFETALRVYEHNSHRTRAQWLVGPVWGVCDPRWLSETILDVGVPFKLNIQTHNYIYGDNKVRGI